MDNANNMYIFAHNGHDHAAEVAQLAKDNEVIIIIASGLVSAAILAVATVLYLRRRKTR